MVTWSGPVQDCTDKCSNHTVQREPQALKGSLYQLLTSMCVYVFRLTGNIPETCPL